jgi:hypothetical protein
VAVLVPLLNITLQSAQGICGGIASFRFVIVNRDIVTVDCIFWPVEAAQAGDMEEMRRCLCQSLRRRRAGGSHQSIGAKTGHLKQWTPRTKHSRLARLEQRIESLNRWLEEERWLIVPETCPRESWMQFLEEQEEFSDSAHEIIAEWDVEEALRFYKSIGRIRGRMIQIPWSWRQIYESAVEWQERADRTRDESQSTRCADNTG